jgi:hypothetical protein
MPLLSPERHVVASRGQPQMLYIQKTATRFRVGKNAGFGAAEDLVAVPGDEMVSLIADNAGKDPESKAEESPASAEPLKGEKDCVGARQQVLIRQFVIQHDVDRVEIAGIPSMAIKDAGGKSALQRGKTKAVLRVALQDELDEAVAEAADAVVEEDGEHDRHGRRRFHTITLDANSTAGHAAQTDPERAVRRGSNRV